MEERRLARRSEGCGLGIISALKFRRLENESLYKKLEEEKRFVTGPAGEGRRECVWLSDGFGGSPAEAPASRPASVPGAVLRVTETKTGKFCFLSKGWNA